MAGGCMSCGYPNGSLRDRTAADTALADKSKSDPSLGYVRYELLAEALDSISRLGRELFDERTRVMELEAMYETSHASRMHAENCVRRLEAENAKLYAALLDLYNAHQNKKVNGAMRASGRWTQIKGLVGEASDREFRVARAEVDEP